MKKALSIVLSLLLMLQVLPMGVFTLAASAEVTEGDYTYTVSNGTATITDVDTSIDGDIVVPSTFDGYPVIGIGSYAFEECKNLTSVILPDGVISIGNYAFYGCSNLCGVKIPNGVTTIGDGAFADCYNFAPIFPDSVTSIGSYAFENCYSISSITIPDSVTSIGGGAFCGCRSLASITIPDSVTSIGERAFYDTEWYNNQPDGLVYVGKVAYTYKGTCPSLVTIKTGTRSIADGAFSNCDNLVSVTLPDSLINIGDSAFYSCNNFTSITIPDSVTSIGDGAFYYCSSLASVTIPDSVSDIGRDAFKNTPWYETWYNNQANGLVYVGKVAYTYKGTCPSSVTIKAGTKGIAAFAFSGCQDLISITIPDSVTGIGASAFRQCWNLASITIPDSVTSIEDATFYGCSSLTSVTLPDSVTSIKDSAFGWCSSLTDVWYGGFEKDQAQISIGEDNAELLNATWHCAECTSHTYDNACDTDCNECGDVRTPDAHKIRTEEIATFTNATNYPFTLVNGVYQSTNKANSSTATATIRVVRDGSITLEYYTSTEANYDKLIIKHNNTDKVTQSGTTSWASITLDVSAGDTISISYSKDGSVSRGDDAVYFKTDLSEWISAEDVETTCEDTVVCDVCGATVKSATSHVYDNACDVICNECGDARGSADHIYDHNCDTDCNICGDIRVTQHSYSSDCDTSCNNCGFTRTVTAYHTFAPNQTECACGTTAFTYTVTDGKVTITGLDESTSGDITIPSTLGGYPVTTIGRYAFYNGYLRGRMITIPDSVTTIEEYAFYGCFCAGITFGNGVTSIGDLAFAYCSGITTLPNSVTTIGEYAFTGSSLKSISIPNSVTSIGGGAFFECGSLTSVIIPDSVTSIERGVFTECGELTSVTIPTSVTTIKESAFLGCGKLTTVYYAGSPTDRNRINIAPNNSELLAATWQYAYDACDPHTYDNDCDTDCNVCGDTRTVTHDYQWVIDEKATCGTNGLKHEECSICHATRNANTAIPATGNHTYDNDQDATCNTCGDVREVQSANEATLTVQSTTVLVGKQAEITVLLANNPGFMYLELTPVFPADWQVTVQNGTLVSDMTQGKQLVWVADEDVTADGLLVTLIFTVPEDALAGDYNIGFMVRGCYNYDEEDVSIIVESGTVTVFDFVYGDATGDGVVDGRDVTRLKKYLANYDYDTDTSTVEIGLGADATGDGVVDGRDVTRLKKYLANYDYDTDSSTTVLGPQ